MAESGGKKIKRINIRLLVEQVFAAGSLAMMAPDFVSAVEGSRIHRQYQQRDLAGVSDYRPELALEHTFEAERVDLIVSGKADGVYTGADGTIHIEEIKTLKHSLDEYPDTGIPVHWAQLKMYGWFYCLTEECEALALDLIYFRRQSGEEKVFSSRFSAEALEAECRPWVEQILGWLDRIEERRLRLSGQLREMVFPFDVYRPGQREFAREAYRGIRDGQMVFLQAATGIGKTMAAVFSTAKALSEDLCEKVFFLTAKNSGSIAAANALDMLNRQKVEVSWIAITAKAKICFMVESEDRSQALPCDPELCPFAKGYYDKLPAAMEELFAETGFSREKVEELARKHEVCPFEYSLDLSLYCDYVIGDYNYAFDYGAGLKRYFRQGKVPFVLLIDEAHNLVDRARDMFSCVIDKKKVLEYRRAADEREKKIISPFNDWLLKLRKKYDEWTEEASEDYPAELDKQVDRILGKFDSLIQSGSMLSKPAYDFYWELYAAKLVLDQYDSSYRTIIKAGKSAMVISLLCVDPSGQIEAVLKNQQAAVFFSATLRPFDYFVSLLAPKLDSSCRELLSGFPSENALHIVNAAVSTRWKMREQSNADYRDIVRMFADGVKGNIIVFSPSFAFQKTLLEQLTGSTDAGIPDHFLVQKSRMTHQERTDFMEALADPVRSTVGFCVIGGSYAESIDFPGERLIGVIIFGLGLPQVNVYTKTVKEYFDARFADGYNYAYVYPGINKVLQAAGRVIRSDTDRGFVYLVDDRYGSSLYRKLFPDFWNIRYERDRTETIAAISELLNSII